MDGINQGKLKNIFAVFGCSLSRFIASKMEFQVPTPESSEHMIDLVRGLNILLSVDFYLVYSAVLTPDPLESVE